MDIKKILLGAGVVVILALFVAYERFFGAPSMTGQNTLPPPGSQTSDTQSQGTPPPPPQGSAVYKDGQYTGSVADAFYGNVQVKAIVIGGKLANVQILAYPDHAGHTLEVSNAALPQLISEAIRGQSANVDAVSGATQTSQAFIQSLSSALAQAGSQPQPNIQVTPPPRPSA